MFLLLGTLNAQDQKIILPKFSSFKGTVYKMPLVERKRGKLVTKRILERYDESVLDYEAIGEIELKTINVPETMIGTIPFPGVELSRQFCMILYASLDIPQSGCYEFILNSDDGSILWIDEAVAVNNDGGHQMRMKKDTVYLNKGDHEAKLWYFQGLPDRFGLQMENNFLSNEKECKLLEHIQNLELQSEVLFDSGSFELSNNAKALIENTLAELDIKEVKSITVIGHTDNVGTEKDNLILSKKRAQSIANMLSSILADPNISIEAKGHGEHNPKATNETEEGRHTNRRVELSVIYTSPLE